MKKWLDTHVVPLTQQEPQSSIYSFIWNGTPPKEILVWLVVEHEPTDDKPFNPAAWPELVRRLVVDQDFKFDYLREQQMVQLENGLVPVFGGDGAPLFGKEGMASARLFRKQDDGISLILQVGCKFPPLEGMSAGQHASAAVKAFFSLFGDENPLTVCSKYGAVFGQA
jgi:hypothetical protein